MADFQDRWTQKRRAPIGEKLKESIISSEPLKTKIARVQKSIDKEITKLDNIDGKLRKKDAQLMHNVVAAMEKHDTEHASTSANELAERRKMNRMTNQSKMVLEQISLRLGSIQELGDAVTILEPIVPVIKGIKGGISGIVPNAGSQIDEISDSLSSLLMDAGQITGSGLNFEANSEDAKSILSEATAVAEQKKIDNLPEVPKQNTNPLQTNPDFTL